MRMLMMLISLIGLFLAITLFYMDFKKTFVEHPPNKFYLKN